MKDSYSVSYGTCQDKSSSHLTTTLYVTNEDFASDDDVQLRDGSSSLPFGDLEDALERAYELSAQYVTASITILLQSSTDYGTTHYLLRTNRPFYQTTNTSIPD